MSLASRPSLLHPAFAGWAALFSGLGLARFAFTPLLPAMIEAGWFSPGGGAAQGAANLAGYLLGAAAAVPIARLVPIKPLLRAAMLLVAISLALCAAGPAGLPGGALLFGLARVLAGAAGGLLMALAPPAVLAFVAPERRGRMGGMMFAGVGCGITGSGIVLPWLIGIGLPAAWVGLAAAALLLAALSWPLWPPAAMPPRAASAAPAGLGRLIGGYALNGLAIVPHMLLLSDFVARGLGAGVAAGAIVFALYGVGAACGPILGGRVADGIGFRTTIRAGIFLQVIAALLPALLPTLPAACVSAVAMGAMTPGLPPLVLGRAVELAGADRARRAWAGATIAYGVCQGLAAWATAAAFAATGRYAPLFVAATAFALLSGLVMDRARAAPLTRG